MEKQAVLNLTPNLAEKILANFFSYLLHPVFIPIYVGYFLIYLHPNAFVGFSAEHKQQVFFIVILNSVFFPLLSVLLLKALGFIKSINLHEQKDRIIPLIATGIFFFWTYTVFKEQARFPDLIRIFFLGIFLASSLGLLVNIYMKISLHTIGMGGWLGFFLVILLGQSMLMTWPIAILILLTGIVCTSRLLISDHTPAELIAGLITGMITQFIAALFI